MAKMTSRIGLGLNLLSIAAVCASACDRPSPAHLALTVDGQPYPSNFQNSGLTIASTVVAITMCVHPSTSSLSAVDDEFCQTFDVASDLYQTLVTPANLRVLGTNSTAAGQPGAPSDANPVWTYAPDADNAPEILAASMLHNQLSATWQGAETQHLDGTLVIEHASATEYDGHVDIDVVGAIPPVDLDVERHAHLSGTFTARPPG